MRTAFKMTAGASALALAGGIAAGCGNATAPVPVPSGAVSHLEGDGYTLSRTIPHSEIAQQYSVGSLLNPTWTTDGATGTRGNSTEQVYTLTAQGQKALRDANTRLSLIGNTGYGDVGLEVHMDPGVLTISGPTDEMQPPTGANAPVPAEPTQPAQYTGDPQADMLVWAYDRGGYGRLMAVSDDMKALPSDPSRWSAVQYYKVEDDIKAAAVPMPTAADPDAHYTAFLADMGQYVRDLENGYTDGAVAQSSAALNDYQGLIADLQAAGVDTSGLR